MTAPHWIICERSGVWASALVRHLQPTTPMRQTRGAAECNAALAAAPLSVVGFEVSRENLGGALELVARWKRGCPLAAIVVLAAAGLEPYELPLREAGAIHVVFSTRRAAEVVRLAERHLEQAPRPTVGYPEQVLQSLPWPERAASL